MHRERVILNGHKAGEVRKTQERKIGKEIKNKGGEGNGGTTTMQTHRQMKKRQQKSGNNM